MSVMLTRVLLKVARMLAMPLTMFFAPLALTIFLPAMSSANNSAAVGAATVAPAGAAVSATAGAATPAAGAPGSAGAAFLGGFSAAGLAPFSGFSAEASDF